jgi:hypothetical protein
VDEKRSKLDKGAAGDKLMAAAAAASAIAGGDKSPLALRRRKSTSKAGVAVSAAATAAASMAVTTTASGSSISTSSSAGHFKANSGTHPSIVPGGDLLNEMNVFNIISGYGKRGAAGARRKKN